MAAKKSTASRVLAVVTKVVAKSVAAPARAVAEAARPGKRSAVVAVKAAKAARKPPRIQVVSRDEAQSTFAKLRAIHPDAHCELNHQNAFELLCATVLSAQTTDVAVNKVTPALFKAYPTAAAMAKAEPEDVEPLIATVGFFRQKSKALVGLAKGLVLAHGGEVPKDFEALTALPGVGRKTANVVLGVIWNAPEGVVVDTHVQRLSQRLGWTKESDPPKIEQDLSNLLPRKDWDAAGHTLIFHGRRICFAAKPDCEGCGIHDSCPSAFNAELVGRKPPRARP